MLNIGEFARYAQVSPRMLRHYDALGVLVPAYVDPDTGYRSYAAGQFSRLHRLMALKDLGFTLEEIGPILDAEVSAERLRGMLLLRRSQLERQLVDDETRLAAIERRHRSIESEDAMSDLEYVEKPVPALRVAQLNGSVTEQQEIGPVIGPMFQRLHASLPKAGVTPTGPDVAWYRVDDGRINFGAAAPVTVDHIEEDGVEIMDLPAAPRAVAVVYTGSMEGIGLAWQTLHREIENRGLAPTGACREVYLETPIDDPDSWATELQQPVT